MIGYEESNQLEVKPAAYFLHVTKPAQRIRPRRIRGIAQLHAILERAREMESRS